MLHAFVRITLYPTISSTYSLSLAGSPPATVYSGFDVPTTTDYADDDPVYTPTVWRYNSRHAGVVNFCFADGSVQFISNNINLTTYRALATIRGGEVIPNF